MSVETLLAHLATGATQICNCWSIVRQDGVTLGFTDHDRPISFDEITFAPESGLTARALASTTGLSVNNTEAIGVLQADAISESDIEAGRYDMAVVTTWLVQWDDPDARQIRFQGTIGEITRSSGGFQAELRGLTDLLNQPQGRSYLTTCSAVLGDARCGVDLDNPAFSASLTVGTVTAAQHFTFEGANAYQAQWFAQGMIEIVTGNAAGLKGFVKTDQIDADLRRVTLWQPIAADIVPGDAVRLRAGCDKRLQTCREKFTNQLNYQGFPDIPGEDWLAAIPRSNGTNTGGSLTK